MDTPILDIFEEDGLINKTTYIEAMSAKNDFENLQLLEKYKIYTALFIFENDISKVVDTSHLEEFYIYTNGSNKNKCYLYDKKFILCITPLGGPAAGGLMEELGFMGITNFFACGSAGQINPNIDSSKFLLVEKAIRCEGISYHYLKPSLYVETNKELNNFIELYLNNKNYKYYKSNTWTTDAFYRETQSEIELRIQQGADSVEMECASWASIAKFRDYKFAQLLYFSDAVKQNNWRHHSERKNLKQMVINLMIDCVLNFVENLK